MGRKKKRGKRRRATRPARTRAAAAPAPAELLPASAWRWIGVGLDVLLVGVCALFLVKTARYAGGARFLTDECFHTYIVEKVLENGIAPDILYDLYSGMRNNTHPLFHWLGAGLHLVGGRDALPYLNVVLCGVMLGTVYWMLRAWVSASAARIAVSVVLLFDVVHVCSQVFYVEMLSALTFGVAVVSLFVAFSRTDWKLFFLAGCACALALLSKQTGFALVPVVVVCGVYFVAMRRWRQVLGVAITAAVFVVTFHVGMHAFVKRPREQFVTVYAPIERRFVPAPLRLFAADRSAGSKKAASSGKPAPPGGTSGREKSGSDLLLQKRSGREVLRIWWHVAGPVGGVLAVLCVVHLVVPRRWGVGGAFGATAPLLLGIGSLLAGAIWFGTVSARHFIATIPVLAACSGVAVSELAGVARRARRVISAGVTVLCVVAAGIAVGGIPNCRELGSSGARSAESMRKRWGGLGQNAPAALVAAARSIPECDSAGTAAVHSMWTSATWYYSGHPATWGSVNVPSLNRVMRMKDPARAFGSFLRNDVRYCLIANYAIDASGDEVPTGYTGEFFGNVTALMRAGVMRVIHPRELAEQQDELLAGGVFDRVLVARPSAQGPAVFYDLPSGEFGQARLNAPLPPHIWGNVAVSYIVVEFDADAFRRFREAAEASGAGER